MDGKPGSTTWWPLLEQATVVTMVTARRRQKNHQNKATFTAWRRESLFLSGRESDSSEEPVWSGPVQGVRTFQTERWGGDSFFSDLSTNLNLSREIKLNRFCSETDQVNEWSAPLLQRQADPLGSVPAEPCRGYFSVLASGSAAALWFWLAGLATSLAEEPAEAATGVGGAAAPAWLWGRLEGWRRRPSPLDGCLLRPPSSIGGWKRTETLQQVKKWFRIRVSAAFRNSN